MLGRSSTSLETSFSPLKVIAIGIIGVLLAVSAAYAYFGAKQNAVRRIDQGKAQYLFGFMALVDWSKLAADAPLTACFFGGSGVYQAFANSTEFKPQTIDGHAVVARSLSALPSSDTCQLLYLDAQALSAQASLLQSDESLRILTVSDAKGFVDEGGMIELVRDRQHLRFSVNPSRIKQNGLSLKADFRERSKALQDEGNNIPIGR